MGALCLADEEVARTMYQAILHTGVRPRRWTS